MKVVGARNISSATRTSATEINRFVHRFQNYWMLSHAQIIVGTPDDDVSDTAFIMVLGHGEGPDLAFKVSKNSIPAFVF
jgi:hypothetical protein